MGSRISWGCKRFAGGAQKRNVLASLKEPVSRGRTVHAAGLMAKLLDPTTGSLKAGTFLHQNVDVELEFSVHLHEKLLRNFGWMQSPGGPVFAEGLDVEG